MRLILINKKIPIVVTIVIFLVSIYLNIISFTEKAEWEKRYETLVCVANQFDNTKIVAFIAASNKSPHGVNKIEIFDVSEGKIVKSSDITDEIKKEAVNNINNITGLYVKVNPIPNKGKIIRVPLGSDVEVYNKWVRDSGITTVEDAFFIYPEEEKSYILILDYDYRPFFFTYEGADEKLRSRL